MSCGTGYLLPSDPLDFHSDWQCDDNSSGGGDQGGKCGQTLSGANAIMHDNNLIKELKKVNRGSIANIEKFLAYVRSTII